MVPSLRSAPPTSTLGAMNTTSEPETQIPIEQLGPAGIHGDLVVLTIMENETRRNEDRLNDRAVRPFKVFARLGKTPPGSDGVKGDFGPEDGCSYIHIPDDAVLSRVRFDGGKLDIKKNSQGEESFIEYECVSTSIIEARNTFLEVVLPFLDHRAFLANSPLFIQAVRVDDVSNQAQSINYISPYRPVIVSTGIVEVPKELAPIFAMYREAKNSHSDFYKFLCYHKIIDGLLGTLRASIHQRARKQKVELQRERNLVPRDSGIAPMYQGCVGKTIKAFFDDVMTPQFRNAIAHFITKDGAILNLSSPTTITRHSEIMYVSELCVRTLIASHQQLLAQLKASNGT